MRSGAARAGQRCGRYWAWCALPRAGTLSPPTRGPRGLCSAQGSHLGPGCPACAVWPGDAKALQPRRARPAPHAPLPCPGARRQAAPPPPLRAALGLSLSSTCAMASWPDSSAGRRNRDVGGSPPPPLWVSSPRGQRGTGGWGQGRGSWGCPPWVQERPQEGGGCALLSCVLRLPGAGGLRALTPPRPGDAGPPGLCGA